jgi:tRNA pseudouridine38-40 synthase
MQSSSSSVLTFAMTIAYNGHAYAGFQRQACTNGNKDIPGKTDGSRKRPHPQSNKSKSKTPITVQQQIESALEQWTNLSIVTLRVRGAGRTDKGVHAAGQVVAFDIPLSLLEVSPSSEGETNAKEEVLSTHALPLLQEAYQMLRKSNGTNEDSQRTSRDPSMPNFLDLWQIRRAISTRLPSDIVIKSVWLRTEVPFEARQGIACKTYIYKIRFRSLRYITTKDGTKTVHPICNAGPHLLRRIHDQNNVWLCPWPLDESLLHSACEAFVGVHNFYNFVHREEHKKRAMCSNGSKADSIEKDYTTDLFSFDVHLVKDGGEGDMNRSTSTPPIYNATFTLKAKGFHRQMVRNLTGNVVDISRGLQLLDNIPSLLKETSDSDQETASRINAAPSCGLCLEHVLYERYHFMKATSMVK